MTGFRRHKPVRQWCWALLCLLAPVILLPADALAVETNTGSAQPYMGYVAAGPFIFKNGGKRLVIQVAVRFRPEAEAIIASPAFGSAAVNAAR